MNKVFELCGWEGPGFMELSRQLEAISPLIHTRGLFLSGGILTDALVPEEARFYQQFLQAQYYRETVVIPGGNFFLKRPQPGPAPSQDATRGIPPRRVESL